MRQIGASRIRVRFLRTYNVQGKKPSVVSGYLPAGGV